MRPIRLVVPLLLVLLVASALPVGRACAPSCALSRATGAAGGCAAGLTDPERDVLAQAQSAAPGLAEERGGEITDHDLKVVAVVLLGVIALALIF